MTAPKTLQSKPAQSSWFSFALVAGLQTAAQPPAPPAAAAAANEAHRGLMPIRVQRAGDEHGAAGVAVRVLDVQDGLWFPEVAGNEIFDRMEQLLPAATTDEHGIAWVPESESFHVLARETGRFGIVMNASRANPVVLDLAPDTAVRARVVDAKGAAVAGTEVALLGADARDRRWVLELVRTDAGGAAELHPLRWRGNQAVDRLLVGLPTGASAAAQALDLGALPTEPVVLVHEPCGTLAVELVDAEGKMVDAGGQALLARKDASGPEGPNALARAPFERGRARFEHVPLGVDFLVLASADALVEEKQGLPVRLEREGESVALPFTVVETFLGAGMKLVSAPGQPLVTTPLFVRWPGAPRPQRVATDAQGFVKTWAGAGFSSEGELRLEVATSDPYVERRSASIAFTPRGPVFHDLGEIMLEPAPLLASGIVVDESGGPLSRAEVRVYELQTQPGARPGADRGRPDLFAFTGADGRFALQGAVEGAFVLQASHARAPAGGKVPVERGSTDVRLQLTRTGAIEVHYRFDAGKEANIALQAFGASGRIAPGRTSMGDGVARLEGLAPGEYTLRCKWGDGGDTLLAEVPGIVVRGGEATLDPRCDPLDLTGKVHLIAIELAEPPDAKELWSVVREHGGQRAFAPVDRAVTDGRATLRTPWPVVDLELRVPGMRTLGLVEVSESARATFEPGPTVRLALADAARERLGARELRVRLTFEGAQYPRPDAAATFDAEGKAELRVCDPGRYNVHLELTAPAPGGEAGIRRCGSPQRIDVLEDGATAEQVIDIDNEYVRTALGL